MADETPVIAPAATPVATAPVSAAPSVPAPAAPVTAPVTAPVEASAPVVVATEAPKSEGSLLGVEPPKPVEPVVAPVAVAPVEPPKEPVSQSDKPAPLPTYEPFKLPEGLTLDDKKLGEFTKELGEFQQKTKADQAAMQEFGQRLMDRYFAETSETVKRLDEHAKSLDLKKRNDWKTSFENDPDIGGNRKDTTLKAAIEFISTHGGTAEQQKELRSLMNETGVGNHPAMIRIMAKAMSAMQEGKPLPATTPSSAPKSKVARRYGA